MQQIETLLKGGALKVAASAGCVGNLEEVPLVALWPTAKIGQKTNYNNRLWAYSYFLNNVRPAALVAV